MLSKWPIRYKLLLCTGLLVVTVGTLAASALSGLYSYRALVKNLSRRAAELPLAAELSRHVSDLRVLLSSVRSLHEFPSLLTGEAALDSQLLRERFRMKRDEVRNTLQAYRDRLDRNDALPHDGIQENRQELETLAEIEAALARIDTLQSDANWIYDQGKTADLVSEVDELHRLASVLPSHLRQRLHLLSDNVRIQYRTAIVVAWVTTGAALVTFATLLRLFYTWIFCPLRLLIRGSREVASGNFQHRIRLPSHDEMSDLAEAMNDMTARFCEIRDDLDRQVQTRTQQVVRSEKLASIGFLAAGVAHEINNPLASIALCSESLQRRVRPLLESADEEQSDVIGTYLTMIGDEAFRCKDITEKLLDFSRMGEMRYQRTELRDLVRGMIEMLQHMGRYGRKTVELVDGLPVFSEVNPQEMKQVVLNLLTNALDSVEVGGRVTVEVESNGPRARLIVTDDGCGMTQEVLTHLFEPFFTRRRNGHGTGLGLSITYSIIADHNGEIEAHSDGPGHGSQFVITLPLTQVNQEKERENQYQAA